MGKISKGLTGTPWHLEYAKGEGVHNSKNCAFNCVKCTCKSSSNHGNVCVGKNDCEEFERGCGRNKYTDTGKKISTNQKESSLKGNRNFNEGQYIKKSKKFNEKLFVEIGDCIAVYDNKNERFEINIQDSKNPFVNKMLSDIIIVKGQKYTIREINKKAK